MYIIFGSVDIRATSFLSVLQVTEKRAKKANRHVSDIFDGFKALGSLQCLRIIKNLPPRQPKIWRCALNKICSFHLDYTRTKGANTATIGFFFAKHLMPRLSMRRQMSRLAVGPPAPTGGLATKRRASLGQPVVFEAAKHGHKLHGKTTIQNTSERPLMRSFSALVA